MDDKEVITIKDFLLGCSGNYPIEDETLLYLSVKTRRNLNDDIEELTARERNMLEVEMLRYLLRAPGMTSSISDTNGTWSHKEGAVEMNSIDKKAIAKRLKELEEELGIVRSTIKLHNRGINMYASKKG